MKAAELSRVCDKSVESSKRRTWTIRFTSACKPSSLPQNLLCVIISDFVATVESRFPFFSISLSLSPPLSLSFSVSLLFKGLHCTVRGRTNDSWGGEERGDREDRQRENEGRCSLCTSLIQHCRGTVFYFRPAEGTVRCGGASIYKEESSVLQMRSRELIQLLLVLRTFRLPF